MTFDVHGQPYDDEKFWNLLEWLQDQKEDSKHNINQVAANSPGLVAHLKHYIDTTSEIEEFVNVEFNDQFTVFKITKGQKLSNPVNLNHGGPLVKMNEEKLKNHIKQCLL